MMKITPIRAATVLLLALGLTACGGGDDTTTTTTTTTSTATPSSVTCDTTVMGEGSVVPTAAQLQAFSGTYAGQLGAFDDSFKFIPETDATMVLNADGSASLDGQSLSLKSVCYATYSVEGKTYEQVVIHWGDKEGVNYTNHVDFFSDNTASGIVNAKIFKSPVPAA